MVEMDRSPQQQIEQDILQCREHTLSLFTHPNYPMDYETFSAQAHPEFSPVGWHLGHIAYIWDHWILSKYAGITVTDSSYKQLFAVDGLAKADRVKLPQMADVYDYVNLVGDRLLSYLKSPNLTFENTSEEKLWRWLIQHESQHAETIAIVLQLLNKCDRPQIPSLKLDRDTIAIPSGYFVQGNDSIDSMDNENSPHEVYVDTFNICAAPVSQSQYQDFINAGGYSQSQWWNPAGWEWLQAQKISKPLYDGIFGDRSHQYSDAPVCGINWYEADAYARFAGMRLPTESEWEKAANYLDLKLGMKGVVWEWTSTLFHPYPDFLPFPYAGYSSAYFDLQHYVLKGGSWASSSYTLRSPFRNWHQPHIRQIFAGLRCVAR
jgi:gamma-glutamyl hercynylcysteine S-oxide synthase